MPLYRVGDRVYSRQFGRGEVTAIVGFGESVQVRVRFETGEEKDLLARYVSLEILERAVEPGAPLSPGGAASIGHEATGTTPAKPREDGARPSPEPETLPGRSWMEPSRVERSRAVRESLAELALDLLGAADVPLMDRWSGGVVVVRPGRPGLQEKIVPLEAFFHKIVMIRDRLRTLEQKINASGSLSQAEKVEMQQYITRIAGSLTTFNFLFRDREDWFSGQSAGQE